MKTKDACGNIPQSFGRLFPVTAIIHYFIPEDIDQLATYELQQGEKPPISQETSIADYSVTPLLTSSIKQWSSDISTESDHLQKTKVLNYKQILPKTFLLTLYENQRGELQC